MAERKRKGQDREEEQGKVNAPAGPNLYPIDIGLNGKLITSIDPVQGAGVNFQTLKNLRYTPNGIKGILGMSKINTTALSSYPKIRSGIHFRKDTPAESHVLVQAYNSGLTEAKIYENETAIPSQGDFNATALHTDSSGASWGRWSKAPDGCIAYCNGVDTMVWGGDEYRVASFINFNPDASFKYDYTEAVTNTLTDSVNTAFLKTVAGGGGNDSNAVLLLNANSDFTDSASGSAPAKTVTASGAVINTTTKKFGAGSIFFDGVNDYCSTLDHADFDYSDGTWTVDFWIYNNADTSGYIYNQQTDANNNIRLYNTSDTLYFRIMSGGTDVVSISCPTSSLSNLAWHHVALVENGDSYKIYIDGVEKGTTTDTDRPANYTGTVYIGSNQGTGNYLSAYIDEFRVSKIARWTADFTPPTAAYSTSSAVTHVYIGSVRPIRGAKFYVLTANTAAATTTAFYWDGSAWASVTNLTDGTASSGKALAQTGSIIFDDTKSIAKTSILYANQFYWYYFKFDGIDNNTAIYYTTLDCSFQAIKDIWDAAERNCLSFKLLKTTLEDYTLQIATDDYDDSASHTFVNLGAMTSSQYCYAGFDNPVTALYFYIAGGKENTNTATISIDYWNGTAWTSVGTVQDATLSSGKTLGRTGIVSWNAIAAGTEFTTSLTNEINFYYYRIGFSATLSANCYLYYLTAIPTQKQIGQYKFPILWQNRLWLCSNQGGKKNWIRGGSYGTVCVFNGSDSVELFFGGDEEVTAAAPLFTRFGGSVYDILIITKRNETYLVDGTSPEDYRVYMVAPNYGCPAPETLRICDMGVETSFGSNKHVAVWQSSNAIVIFDGNTIMPISDDISNFFDPADSRCINSSMVHRSIGFYNKNKREYTWCFASGSSTSLNEEWVYNFRENKWYEVDRGSKDLQLGINVIDTNGNDFIYGAIDTGYLERLENGTSWDGSDMTYNFRTSDMSFNGVMYETSIRFLKLAGKAKNITANDISITHYLNGSSTATTPSITAISPDSSNRIFQVVRSLNSGKGTYHSLDFSIITNNETIGLEPLRLGLMVKVEREDIK